MNDSAREKVFEFNGKIRDISTVLSSVALAVCLLLIKMDVLGWFSSLIEVVLY